MRRFVCVCLSALALVGTTGLAMAVEGDDPVPTTTTTPPNETTTTLAPVPLSTTTTPAPRPTTTTTARSASTTTTTRGAVPPPASGASQPLVEDLLGSPIVIETTTTTAAAVQFAPLTGTTVPADQSAASPISASSNSPSGLTLILAAIAWLASVGGVFVYAEERRSSRWKHLAR